MINRSIICCIFAFVPIVVHGDDIAKSNDIGEACITVSNMNTMIHNADVSNNNGTTVFDGGRQKEPEQGSPMRFTQRIWLHLGVIALFLGAIVDWCSKHRLWRCLVWVVKSLVHIFCSRRGKKSCQHNAVQKVGSQKIGDINCGDHSVVSVYMVQNPKQNNGVKSTTEVGADKASCAQSENQPSEQKLWWNEMEKNFNPYKPIKAKGTLKQIVEENLCVIDMLRATCPKKHIPICVIDDKDDEMYREGLKTLGYENVTLYPKCPVYDVLKPFAIVIFDVRGVGNAAGKDGFSLAVTFKSEYPLKVVGVRTNFLQDVSEMDRSKLNFALEKKRDLCDQLVPVLNAALKDVGDPIAMWKKARMILLETSSVRELALIEHEYVQAIRLLSQDTDALPGEWMSGVNRLLKRRIF